MVTFVGDIALPAGTSAPTFDDPPWSAPVVANLEGTVSDRPAPLGGLTSATSVVEVLRRLGVVAVSVANNHMADVGGDVESGLALVRSAGIQTFGVGRSTEEASTPAVLRTGDGSLALLGFGWRPIGCTPPRRGRWGVNQLSRDAVLRQTERVLESGVADRVVLVVHWNYELELYPQPAHRELAFDAIRAGAHAVIGSHSHVASGVEVVDGHPIAYGLGNWMLPSEEALGFAYPEISRAQLAVELDGDGTTCHWFESDAGHIRHVASEAADGDRAAERTPFAAMSSKEYGEWFRVNRRKRKLLPVYLGGRVRAHDALLDRFVLTRGALLSAAFRSGVKAGPQ